MSGDWVTWGLQLLIAGVLGVVWKRLEATTDAINDMRVNLPATYLPRSEYEQRHKELRESLHDIRDGVLTPLSNQVAILNERSNLAPLIARVAEKLK